MSIVQSDVNEHADNSGEQDKHETHVAHLGAIEQRLDGLLRTVPKIEINERHILKLEDLRQIVKGFRATAAELVVRDRTPDV